MDRISHPNFGDLREDLIGGSFTTPNLIFKDWQKCEPPNLLDDGTGNELTSADFGEWREQRATAVVVVNIAEERFQKGDLCCWQIDHLVQGRFTSKFFFGSARGLPPGSS
jgi:hypothetical protein